MVAWTSIGAMEIVHIHHSLSIRQAAGGHLGNFQLGAIASNVPMHILGLVIWGTDICIEYIPRSGIMSKSVADTTANINCITLLPQHTRSCLLKTHASIYCRTFV